MVFSLFFHQAIIAIAERMKLRSISLISSDYEATKHFVSEATANGIRIPRILELSHKQLHRDLPRYVLLTLT